MEKEISLREEIKNKLLLNMTFKPLINIVKNSLYINLYKYCHIKGV